MKTGRFISLLAVLAGFLAGYAVMHCILPGKAATPNLRDTNEHGQTRMPSERGQSASPEKSPESSVQTAELSGSAARRVLAEIKRNKTASVDVQFFSKNEFHVSDGKLAQQFIDFFELTPLEADRLTDLIQTTKAEMWNAAKSHAQITRSDTGGVVLKIPPLAEGPDAYARVMDGMRATLGEERYGDMVLFNKSGAGGQLEDLFREFGAEARVVSIEKSGGERYKITERVVGKPGTVSSGHSYTGTVDEIKKRNPEYVEFIPSPAQ